MIIVTVRLLPGGLEAASRTIAAMRISNCTELSDISDYCVEAWEAANPLAGTAPRKTEFVVCSHLRRQSVWALLLRAVEAIANADSEDAGSRPCDNGLGN